MSEIKEKEYIRTIKGNICKVLSIREKHRFMTGSGHPSVTPERYFVDNSKQYSISKPYIKKHSFDIIDLIEEGDYVNGNRIDKFEIVTNDITNNKAIKEFSDIDSKHLIYDFEIRSIVTKEQFNNMEYRV